MLLKRMNKLTQILQNEGGNVDFSELGEVLPLYWRLQRLCGKPQSKLLGYALEGDLSTPLTLSG